MEIYEVLVRLSIEEAAKLCRNQISGSFSGEQLDDHAIRQENFMVRVLVFEKYFMRVENRLTVTITIDNFLGNTRVHMVSGGGGNSSIFRFSWGAESSFLNEFAGAFDKYRI